MKKRFTINVTKGYIITAILFLLGVLMVFLGFLDYLELKKGQKALPMNELNESQIKDGQYVRGVIHEIAGYYEEAGDEDSFFVLQVPILQEMGCFQVLQ